MDHPSDFFSPHWATDENLWSAFVPVNPSFQGSFFTCLDHTRETLPIVAESRSLPSGLTVLSYFLDKRLVADWQQVENTLDLVQDVMNAKLGCALTLVGPHPPRPSAYGYSKSYDNHADAMKHAWWSRCAFIVKMAFLSYQMCIRPQWDQALLPYVCAETITVFQNSWIPDRTVRRVGMFIDATSSSPPRQWYARFSTIAAYMQLPMWIYYGRLPLPTTAIPTLQPFLPSEQEILTARQPAERCHQRQSQDDRAEQPTEFLEYQRHAREEILRNGTIAQRELLLEREKTYGGLQRPLEKGPAVFLWESTDILGGDSEGYIRRIVSKDRIADLWRQTSPKMRVYHSVINAWDVWDRLDPGFIGGNVFRTESSEFSDMVGLHTGTPWPGILPPSSSAPPSRGLRDYHELRSVHHPTISTRRTGHPLSSSSRRRSASPARRLPHSSSTSANATCAQSPSCYGTVHDVADRAPTYRVSSCASPASSARLSISSGCLSSGTDLSHTKYYGRRTAREPTIERSIQGRDNHVDDRSNIKPETTHEQADKLYRCHVPSVAPQTSVIAVDPIDVVLSYRYGFRHDTVSSFDGSPTPRGLDAGSLWRILSYSKTKDTLPSAWTSSLINFVSHILTHSIPPSISDLEDTRASLLAQSLISPRLSWLKTGDVERKVYILEATHLKHNEDFPWLLIVESATTVLHMARHQVAIPGKRHLVSRFVHSGIPFRTALPPASARPGNVQPYPVRSPTGVNSGLGWRLPGFRGNAYEYSLYEELRDEFLRSQCHAYAALQQGGIIWRLSRPRLLEDVVLDGPRGHPATQQRFSINGKPYVVDVLSPHEEDLICGVYKVLNGQFIVPFPRKSLNTLSRQVSHHRNCK